MIEGLNNIEANKIIDFVDRNYNLNLSNYCQVILQRKLQSILNKHHLQNADHLIAKFSSSSNFIDLFICDLQTETTELFREPSVWIKLAKTIIPQLILEFKAVNIWIADCTSGEDLYSTIILINEYFNQSPINILVTSTSETLFNNIKNGKICSKKINLSEKNFKEIFPEKSLSNYFKQELNNFYFDTVFFKNVKYQKTNLLTNKFPEQVNLLLYRNKVQFFNHYLQNIILNKLAQNLTDKCIIVPGIYEKINTENIKTVDVTENIYQVIHR